MANHSTCERPGPEEVLGECVISSVLCRHNKTLKRQTSVTALGWASVTAPCYTSVLFRKQRKMYPRGVREGQPIRCKEKRGLRFNFGSCFYVFLLPTSLPYVDWASQEGCLFYLRSSLPSLDLPLLYFCGFSPSLSFSHSHFGLLFPILTT